MAKLYSTTWLRDLMYFIHALEPNNKATIGLGGVRNLGKTTAIIQLWRFLGGLQPVDADGIRSLRIAIFRDEFSTISRNILESMSEWYDWHTTGASFNQVFHGHKAGLAAKSLRQSPEIVTYEKTMNLLDILNGEPPKWDGTYTRVHYVAYSTSKPDFSSKLRGAQFHSCWLNEPQTMPYESFAQASSIYGRPEKAAHKSIILCDYNFPNPISDNSKENKENVGYEWVKNEFEGTGIVPLGRDSYKYSVHLEPPYKFIEDKDATRFDSSPKDGVYYREYRGKKGFLVENPLFVEQVPYKKNPFSQYDNFLDKPDHIVQTDLLGEFGDDGTGEAVYYMFKKDEHVVSGIDESPIHGFHRDKKLIIGIDFGYAQPAAILCYVDDLGNLKILKEFVKEKTSLRDMLAWDIVPYLEKHFEYHWKNNQLIFVGDPTSGSSSSYINSATPMNVLTGETDEDGKEDGDGVRYKFEAYHSPCGNQIKYRIDSSYTYLNRKGGVQIIEDDCKVLIEALSKQYVWGSNGKPKKVQNDIHTGVVDAFQYVCAYLYAGGEYVVENRNTFLTKHIRDAYMKRKNKTRR